MRGLAGDDLPVLTEEASRLFATLPALPQATGVVLAVSGGPDSTALMGLYAAAQRQAALPPATVVTIDHALREGSGAEAAAVSDLAATFGLAHHVLQWTGKKPATGIQAAARDMRYGLLIDFAQTHGTSAILTAHTRDDQAETVLMRLARGSGIKGLAAMDAVTLLGGLQLYRPFLGLAKTRLIETCRHNRWPYSRDPSNENPGFLRVRLRKLAPALAREGLTAARLARLAERMRRADEALASEGQRVLELCRIWGRDVTVYDAARLAEQHDEIVVRIFQHVLTIARNADSPALRPRLERIEALANDFRRAVAENMSFRRNAGGVLFTLRNKELTFQPEPARKSKKLTKSGKSRAGMLGNAGAAT